MRECAMRFAVRNSHDSNSAQTTDKQRSRNARARKHCYNSVESTVQRRANNAEALTVGQSMQRNTGYGTYALSFNVPGHWHTRTRPGMRNRPRGMRNRPRQFGKHRRSQYPTTMIGIHGRACSQLPGLRYGMTAPCAPCWKVRSGDSNPCRTAS